MRLISVRVGQQSHNLPVQILVRSALRIPDNPNVDAEDVEACEVVADFSDKDVVADWGCKRCHCLQSLHTSTCSV